MSFPPKIFEGFRVALKLQRNDDMKMQIGAKRQLINVKEAVVSLCLVVIANNFTRGRG